MGAQRDHFEKWFARRRGPRFPQDEAVALEAADAFDAIQQSRTLATQHIDLIVAAATSVRGLVWNCGIDLLKKLMKDWPEVANAIRSMSKSGRANVRFSAMCCVTESMPIGVADALIEAGLFDRSARVRWNAGEKAEWLNRVKMVPLLARAVAVEKVPKTRRSLNHSLRLLRDGYILDKESDGTYSFWVRTPDGHGGRSITEAELQAKGIQRIIREFRESRF